MNNKNNIPVIIIIIRGYSPRIPGSRLIKSRPGSARAYLRGGHVPLIVSRTDPAQAYLRGGQVPLIVSRTDRARACLGGGTYNRYYR